MERGADSMGPGDASMLSMRPAKPMPMLPHLPGPVILQGQYTHADELRRRRRRQELGPIAEASLSRTGKKKSTLPVMPVYQTTQPGRVCQISLGAPPRHLTFWHWHWKDGQPVKASPSEISLEGLGHIGAHSSLTLHQNASEPVLHLPALIRAQDEAQSTHLGAAPTMQHAAVSSSAPALPELPPPADLTQSPQFRRTKGSSGKKSQTHTLMAGSPAPPKDAAALEAKRHARREARLSGPGGGGEPARGSRSKQPEQVPPPKQPVPRANRSDLRKSGKVLPPLSQQVPAQQRAVEDLHDNPAIAVVEEWEPLDAHRPSIVWGQQVLAELSSKNDTKREGSEDWTPEGIKQRLRRQSEEAMQAAAEPETRRRLSTVAREPASKRVEAYLERQGQEALQSRSDWKVAQEVERVGFTSTTGPWRVEVRILPDEEKARMGESQVSFQPSVAEEADEGLDGLSNAPSKAEAQQAAGEGSDTLPNSDGDQDEAADGPHANIRAGSKEPALSARGSRAGSKEVVHTLFSRRSSANGSRAGSKEPSRRSSCATSGAYGEAVNDAVWHSQVNPQYKSVLPYVEVDKATLEQAFNKFRADASREILVEDVPAALQQARYRNIRTEFLDEIIPEIAGEGSFVSLQEFWEVVQVYNERRLNELHQEFGAADEGRSGWMDIATATGTLRKNGVMATPCIVRELLEELHSGEIKKVSARDYVELRGIFQYRGGFTNAEAADARSLFNRYDSDHGGRMDKEELERSMKWLGLHLQEDDDAGPNLEQLLEGLELTESGLSFEDFLQVMRHHREAEITWAKQLFNDRAAQGDMDVNAANSLLVKMGFTSNTAELVEETAHECGIDHEKPLSFDDVYLVLRLIRKREGFTPKEVEEFRQAYGAHDTNDSNGVDVVELGGALRWCGYPCTIEEQQDFMDEVDIDKSGEIDFDEFLKIMRWYKEKEFVQVQKAFVEGDLDGSGTLDKKEIKKLLPTLGYYTLSEEHKETIEKWTAAHGELSFKQCRDMIEELRIINREDFREKHGFLDSDLLRLKREFERVDEDGSGEIAKHELAHLLEECVPESAKTLEGREYAKSLVEKVDGDGDGSLSWFEFLHLMRLVQDRADYDAILREQEAAAKAGFSHDEVKDLRKAFKLCDSDASKSLDVEEVINMLANLIPHMSRRVKDEIRDIVQENDEDGTNTLDFAEFLAVMRRVQDENIVELSPTKK